MEDQKRGMEFPEPKIPHVREQLHHESRLTIMIIRSVGKVRSFRISPRVLLVASIVFLLYIPLSILVINNYFNLRHQNTTQLKKIKRLEGEIFRSKKAVYKSKQHIALLEDYIHNLEKRQKQEPEPSEDERPQEMDSARSVEQTSKVEAREKKSAKLVDIEDISVQKQGSKMTVDFKLVNVLPGDKAVGGYIHIIAENKNVSPPQAWSYPEEKLENGVPINFRRGLIFLIQRFKPVQCEFDFGPDSEIPSSLKVLAYDQSGVVILEKEFEVKDAS